MSSSGMTILSLGQGFSLLVALVARVAVLVVITTVVRRHRPDAHGALMLWAILEVASVIVLPVVGAMSSYLTAGDVESLLRGQALSLSFGAIVHATLVALLVRGLVKLAQPPPPVEVPAEGPYR